MLTGKRLSILGDSISTYLGVSNDITANSQLFANRYHYKPPFPLEKTYWSILIDKFGLNLCVNNSWAGSPLSGKDYEHSGLNRAAFLSKNNGEKPDFIIVFMGINDLGRMVDVSVFNSDYEATLAVIKEKYKDAMVCCVNLPDRDIFLRERAVLFNQAIEKSVKAMGNNFFIADLFGSRLNNDFYYMNTTDGLHPDEDGMGIIAEVIAEAIKKHISS